jgi:hypothetical protein
MRPYTLTHTPKTFASKDTRYQATTNQEIITTTTHHPSTGHHHPKTTTPTTQAMHREMLASTVQFSRDNQALKPHQHPPDTTRRSGNITCRRQHTPHDDATPTSR